jgi:hypothetical protein
VRVDEGAQVAVQALEGGEAVVFSHGRVVRASWAWCAAAMGGSAACGRVWACCVFFDGASLTLATERDFPICRGGELGPRASVSPPGQLRNLAVKETHAGYCLVHCIERSPD